jgi:membrane protein
MSSKSLNVSTWKKVATEILSDWADHGAMTHGAALAFYTLFSLAPVLIFAITVSGLVFGEEAVRGQIVRQFEGLMGREQAVAIERILQRVSADRSTGLAGVLGFVTLAFGATAVFVQLQSALNAVWDVEPKPGPLLKTLLKKRLTSFALVMALGFLLLVSLALSAAVNAFGDWVQARFTVPPEALDAGNVLLSFAIFTVLFAMIYRILPDVEIPWRDVWFGALITSLLFSVGKWGIGLYLGRTAVASPYGAAGSVIVIVLWVYYASLILLFGAEFTRVYSRHFLGSRRVASPGAHRVRRVREEVGETR